MGKLTAPAWTIRPRTCGLWWAESEPGLLMLWLPVWCTFDPTMLPPQLWPQGWGHTHLKMVDWQTEKVKASLVLQINQPRDRWVMRGEHGNRHGGQRGIVGGRCQGAEDLRPVCAHVCVYTMYTHSCICHWYGSAYLGSVSRGRHRQGYGSLGRLHGVSSSRARLDLC